MKKIISLVLVLILSVAFMAGCGKKDRVLYTEKLQKYVDLGEYKGIKIDTSSDEYKSVYDSVIKSDVQNNSFYVQKKEGTVAKGDTANIDYEGKKDGVAFEGGTAKGYDLTIGSGSFIEGFEDGLIGKKIGDTVDLNLTFPENYGKEELNGAAVVFTVKINYVTTEEPLTPAEYYKELKFGSEAKYIEDVNKRAAEEMLLTKLTESSKIKSYPEKEKEYLFTQSKKAIEQNLQSYGYTLETYLSSMGQTEEQFKEEAMKNQILPMMDLQMIIYSVLDKEGIEVTKTDINAQAEKVVAQYDNQVTVEKVKEVYGEYQLEYLAANEKALEVIYKNAVIK